MRDSGDSGYGRGGTDASRDAADPPGTFTMSSHSDQGSARSNSTRRRPPLGPQPRATSAAQPPDYTQRGQNEVEAEHSRPNVSTKPSSSYNQPYDWTSHSPPAWYRHWAPPFTWEDSLGWPTVLVHVPVWAHHADAGGTTGHPAYARVRGTLPFDLAHDRSSRHLRDTHVSTTTGHTADAPDYLHRGPHLGRRRGGGRGGRGRGSEVRRQLRLLSHHVTRPPSRHSLLEGGRAGPQGY